MKIFTNTPYKNLPREQQRFLAIEGMARFVWINNRSRSPQLNWQEAEDSLCEKYPEFRCARALFSCLSRLTGFSLNQFEDSKPITHYLDITHGQFAIAAELMRELGLQQPYTGVVGCHTLGDLIAKMAKDGF